MKVEFLFFSDCPHADAARSLLHGCISALGVAAIIEEHEGDYASPTILIEGTDVMDTSATTGRCCRLDLPTEERILTALRRRMPGAS